LRDAMKRNETKKEENMNRIVDVKMEKLEEER